MPSKPRITTRCSAGSGSAPQPARTRPTQISIAEPKCRVSGINRIPVMRSKRGLFAVVAGPGRVVRVLDRCRRLFGANPLDHVADRPEQDGAQYEYEADKDGPDAAEQADAGTGADVGGGRQRRRGEQEHGADSNHRHGRVGYAVRDTRMWDDSTPTIGAGLRHGREPRPAATPRARRAVLENR